MNWGEIIFLLLSAASVFVLVIVVFVLKSVKQVDNKKDSSKQGQ